jgi:hypothetical protein
MNINFLFAAIRRWLIDAKKTPFVTREGYETRSFESEMKLQQRVHHRSIWRRSEAMWIWKRECNGATGGKEEQNWIGQLSVEFCLEELSADHPYHVLWQGWKLLCSEMTQMLR